MSSNVEMYLDLQYTYISVLGCLGYNSILSMATYYRIAPFVKPREAIRAENRLSLGSTFRNIFFKGVQKAELGRE